MATPYLYNADETSFTHNGYGTLADTIECLVTESPVSYTHLDVYKRQAPRRYD